MADSYLFETTATFPQPVPEVFALLCQVATRVELALPSLQLRRIEGPDSLQLGSRLVVEGRRMGLTRQMTSEITALKENALIVEEQRQGPFAAYKHTQRLEVGPDGGTRLTDTIEYAPPGGMLGFVLTPQLIQSELRSAFAHRDRRLAEILLTSSRRPEP